jgi:hypothetical protein
MYLVRIACPDCGRTSKFPNTTPASQRFCLLCEEDVFNAASPEMQALVTESRNQRGSKEKP